MDLKAIIGALALVLTVGGLSSVGGCFAEPERASVVGGRTSESNGAAVSAPTPEPSATVDDGPDRGSRSPSAVVNASDDVDLDPFGLLSSGLGFDTYSTNCELTDDPFADCL